VVGSAGSSNVTLTWTATGGTTWYQIWVGTAGAAQTYTFQWQSSSVLGCINPGATCTAVLPLALPAGTYYAAVQSAGPGGWLTMGGSANNGFTVSDPFNIP